MSEKMKILIAYDGSECADAALNDLRRAGLPSDVTAVIISVAEVWLPPPPSSYEILEEAKKVNAPADLQDIHVKDSPAVQEAQGRALSALNRVKSMFPGWEATAVVSNGSPAWDIIMKADQWKPDLIVVGSHGRTAIERIVLGSVSQKIVTEARCSVRVARGSAVEEADAPIRIMVALDGSHGSRVAAREVARRVWPPETEVRVIVVNDPLTPNIIGRLIPPVAHWIEESNREDQSWVHKMVDDAVNALSAAALKVSSVVAEGDPKRVLVEEAKNWGASCIFVGSTGFSSRFARFMLGSVSSAVVARAHCSVEVVREKQTGEEQPTEEEAAFVSAT
jgi:nucleotide-binding universal stress UspA family protein